MASASGTGRIPMIGREQVGAGPDPFSTRLDETGAGPTESG